MDATTYVLTMHDYDDNDHEVLGAFADYQEAVAAMRAAVAAAAQDDDEEIWNDGVAETDDGVTETNKDIVWSVDGDFDVRLTRVVSA